MILFTILTKTRNGLWKRNKLTGIGQISFARELSILLKHSKKYPVYIFIPSIGLAPFLKIYSLFNK